MQKIASNYISGFIILMDRSVGIGDLITVDNHSGQLTKMTARYVVVRSLSGLEAIIPNETIITSTVLNHSYTDRRVRIAMPGGKLPGNIQLRLQDPPDGIAIQTVAAFPRGTEIVLVSDASRVKAGLRGNLIVTPRGAGPGRPARRARRRRRRRSSAPLRG